MGERIQCQFNLFQEGRTYTGHHRNYILESAVKTCYDPGTRELIKLREAFGYYGHGRRLLGKSLRVDEVSTVKMPDGSSVIVENVPSNVTVSFEVGKDGTVTHEQEILETAPGKIVAALNASKVGGFSWACGGSDGGAGGTTRVNGFYGFDYVKNPGFAANRGYILESADEGLILESVAQATGLPDTEVERLMRSWVASAVLENAHLQERLEDAAVYEDALRERVETATAEAKGLREAEERRRSVILECAPKSLIVIPAKVQEAMVSLAGPADFQEIVAFFESARQVDLSQLPIGDKKKLIIPHGAAPKPPEYGSTAAGYDFDRRF